MKEKEERMGSIRFFGGFFVSVCLFVINMTRYRLYGICRTQDVDPNFRVVRLEPKEVRLAVNKKQISDVSAQFSQMFQLLRLFSCYVEKEKRLSP